MCFRADRFTCCLFSSSSLLHAASSALTSPPPAVKSQRPPGRPCSFFPSGPASTGKTPDFCQIPPRVLPPSMPPSEIPACLLCTALACMLSACARYVQVESRFLFDLLLFSKDETNSPTSKRVTRLGHLRKYSRMLPFSHFGIHFPKLKVKMVFLRNLACPTQHIHIFLVSFPENLKDHFPF